MRKTFLLFGFLISICLLCLTSCKNEYANFEECEFQSSDLNKLEISTLNNNIVFEVDAELESNCLIKYSKSDKETIDFDKSTFKIQGDNFNAKIFIKNSDILDDIVINSKVSFLKIYNYNMDKLDIKSNVLYLYIVFNNIDYVNIESELFEYSEIHESNFETFNLKASSIISAPIHDNKFDSVSIKLDRNNFQFMNNTFDKCTIIKDTGNIDINLPANKGIYAEINCPDVLFDFETVSFNNKYYYLTPEYELYIENPNGAVSITRYFPE